MLLEPRVQAPCINNDCIPIKFRNWPKAKNNFLNFMNIV